MDHGSPGWGRGNSKQNSVSFRLGEFKLDQFQQLQTFCSVRSSTDPASRLPLRHGAMVASHGRGATSDHAVQADQVQLRNDSPFSVLRSPSSVVRNHKPNHELGSSSTEAPSQSASDESDRACLSGLALVLALLGCVRGLSYLRAEYSEINTKYSCFGETW
jgi:hypothetical protein